MCSEIYLYRARVGDFQQKTPNAKLAALVGARKEPPATPGTRAHSLTSEPKHTTVQDKQMNQFNFVGSLA